MNTTRFPRSSRSRAQTISTSNPSVVRPPSRHFARANLSVPSSRTVRAESITARMSAQNSPRRSMRCTKCARTLQRPACTACRIIPRASRAFALASMVSFSIRHSIRGWQRGCSFSFGRPSPPPECSWASRGEQRRNWELGTGAGQSSSLEIRAIRVIRGLLPLVFQPISLSGGSGASSRGVLWRRPLPGRGCSPRRRRTRLLRGGCAAAGRGRRRRRCR